MSASHSSRQNSPAVSHQTLDECLTPLQVNKAQLSATVSSQVEAARSGMELLDTAQRTLTNMRECYQVQGQHSAPQRCTILLSRSCQLWRTMRRPPEP